jgi:putative copper resistance protein D
VESTGWDAAAALAKAITYAGTLGAAGAIFFLNYNERSLHDGERRGIVRSVVMLSAVAALAGTARILLLAASISDNLAGMFDVSFAGMILRAGEGSALAIRIAGLILCTAVLLPGWVWTRLAFFGALLAAASFAAVGHVHALKPNFIPSLLLMLHLWCGAFWLGALWPLLRVARGGDNALTAALAARFGNIALLLVALLVAAGALLMYRLLGSIADMWSSGYGRMLSLKLLLVVALLSAAAVNKLRLTPRLAAGDAAAALHLRRSVGLEMMLGSLILLVTAAFTTLGGPPGL